MSKIAQKRQDYLSRSGNSSTVPSASGANLMGYGAEEKLSPMQRREALIRACEVLKEKRKLLHFRSNEFRELGLEMNKFNAEIKAINEEHGLEKDRQNVGDFLVKMFKARVTHAEWQIIVAEAKRMCAAQDALIGYSGQIDETPIETKLPDPLYLALGITSRSYAS
jgi:hypothetical protein